MFDFKVFFGIVAIVISLLGYFAYFRNIFKGKTKPHVFSWLIWGIVTGIEFVGQLYGHAGAGAWVTGLTTIACLSIAVISFKKGNLDITRIDQFSFVGAIFAIALWIITRDPSLSVLLGILIDALGYIPTFRKSYKYPYQETVISWFMNGLKFSIALLALERFNFLSSIYPIYLVISNWMLVAWILIRRRQIKR